MIVFLKDFFKLILKAVRLGQQQKHVKLPTMQTVKEPKSRPSLYR